MKSVPSYFSLFFFLFFGLSSCTEVGPDIEIQPPKRKVIMEEFTGVRCTNCIDAHIKTEDLLTLHGDNLIVVSIHTGFFSGPLVESIQDFTTTYGSDLESLLGPVSVYPSATINRQLFDSEAELVLESSKWAGYIADELAKDSPVELSVTTSYDAGTRSLTVLPEIIFYRDLSQPIHISVLLTENNIVDAQLSDTGTIPDYTHKHVLRTMLTGVGGDLLSETTVGSSPVALQFSGVIPADWVAENLSAVVSVHYPSPAYGVLQAEEVYVAP